MATMDTEYHAEAESMLAISIIAGTRKTNEGRIHGSKSLIQSSLGLESLLFSHTK